MIGWERQLRNFPCPITEQRKADQILNAARYYIGYSIENCLNIYLTFLSPSSVITDLPSPLEGKTSNVHDLHFTDTLFNS